jgi:hypothetical protein
MTQATNPTCHNYPSMYRTIVSIQPRQYADADMHVARITALSSTLIKRLENILAVALDDTTSQRGEVSAPPSLVETSVHQFQLDVETTAVIRAAEEIMMLTRSMKEIWLFGELDTIKADASTAVGPDEAAGKMQQDIALVESGFQKFLAKHETILPSISSA